MEKTAELNHLTLSESNLTRTISWAVAADQKAGIILTFVLFSLGYLFSQTSQGLKIFFTIIRQPEKFNGALGYISLTLLILLSFFADSSFFGRAIIWFRHCARESRRTPPKSRCSFLVRFPKCPATSLRMNFRLSITERP